MRDLDGVQQSVENWGLSDHRAVSLSMGDVDFGPKPFRFYSSWMLEDDFKFLVDSWWNSPLVAGWAGATLHDKLKSLKKEIKSWKGSRANAVTDRIASLETDLQSTMDQILRDGSSNSLRAKRLKVLDDLWNAFRLEECRWRQKSRSRWAKEGDRNSAFFHRQCKIRVAKQNITKLSTNGLEIEDAEGIKQAIFQHYKSFFTSQKKRRPRLRCPNIQRLSRNDQADLEKQFSEAEIWDVVKSFDGNKAPGPDGFNMKFFQEFWSLVRVDV